MATVGHARDQQDTVETVPGLVAASTQAVDVERGEHDKNKDKDEDSLEAKERDQHGSIDYEKMQHQAIGVTRIETLWRHFGTNRPVLTALGLSIFLVCCAFIFDSSTTGAYELFAVSYFKDHARLLGVINTVEAILNAVSKPFIAKMADMTSRQTAYCFLLVLYVVGYIVIATAQNGIALAVGRVISTVGQAGLDLVTDIIVADLTPLEWRGVFTAFTSAPFIWFAWIGPEISGPIIRNSQTGWRWGFGMFAIIVPACVLPAALFLFWADWKARQHGEMRVAESLFERRWREEHPDSPIPGKWNVFLHWCQEMDVIGLFLLGWSWALLLLPFSLAPSAQGRWSSPSMIAMLAVGAVLLIAFIAWEWKCAPSPMLTRNLLYNRTFLLAVTIDFFYFLAGSLRSLWWSSYVYVVSDWSLENWNRYTNAETVGLCVFGIMIGGLLRLTHRYKGMQITGLCVRIIGMGIVVYTATRVTVPTAAFAVIPVLIALGGACSVVGTRVASQASVPHHDLGQVIAQLALWTRIGGAVGSAIASTVWQSNMQDNMRAEGVPAADIPGIYGSIRTARAKYAWGSDNHRAVVRAYNTTVRPLFIAGLAVTVIPLVCALLMPNYYLGKSHNKVERNDVAGRKIGGDAPITHEEQERQRREEGGERTIWQKIKANLY